jgi:hypothetical protein
VKCFGRGIRKGASPVLFVGRCGTLVVRAARDLAARPVCRSVSRSTWEEKMSKRLWLLLAVGALIGGSASAQNTGMAALQAAAQKMGVTNMKSIQYSGAGWQGMVGQNFSPDRDWPRVDLKDYTRTIDFDTMSSKEEYTRSQGSNTSRVEAPAFRSFRTRR